MNAEQLSLPRLKVPQKGPVAVVLYLKDTETENPKVLMAKKPSGKWTFPGGKLRWWRGEYKNPPKGARRELWEETGLEVFDEDDLIESHLSPIRVAADGREKNIHFMFCFSDESSSTDLPIHREPKKNGPWQYVPIRRLPWLIAAGKLHNIASRMDLQIFADEARRVVEESAVFARSISTARRLQEAREGEYGFLAHIHNRDLVDGIES